MSRDSIGVELANTWLGKLEQLNERLKKSRTAMEEIIGQEESGQKAQADSTCLADEVSVQISDAAVQASILYEQVQRLATKIGQHSQGDGTTHS